MIKVKSIHDKIEDRDGIRIMVERDWPPEVGRGKADFWFPELGPSRQLEEWFMDHPGQWPAYKDMYKKELTTIDKEKIFKRIRSLHKRLIRKNTPITFLYATAHKPEDDMHNNAAIVKEMI